MSKSQKKLFEIANNLDILKRMIDDYRCLYQMEREIELYWIKQCDNVRTF